MITIKVKVINSDKQNEVFEFNSYKDLMAFAMEHDLDKRITQPVFDPSRFYDAMTDHADELSPLKKKKHLLARLLGL